MTVLLFAVCIGLFILLVQSVVRTIGLEEQLDAARTINADTVARLAAALSALSAIKAERPRRPRLSGAVTCTVSTHRDPTTGRTINLFHN